VHESAIGPCQRSPCWGLDAEEGGLTKKKPSFEDRGQRTEDREQRTEDRAQSTEDGGKEEMYKKTYNRF
jgi:hypothetical protein